MGAILPPTRLYSPKARFPGFSAFEVPSTRLVRVCSYHGLEALFRDGRCGLQPVGAGSCEHLPGRDLRGAVPTYIERYFVFGPGFSDDGGRLLRLSLPRESEGPVGLELGDRKST